MTMQAFILIVEDEPKIAEGLAAYLKNAGFRTHCLDRGDRVARFVRQESPDLVLLDIMLPGKDGMEVCKELRSFSQVPIIMLTARVEEIDRLLGLELGADDYVCKPFSPREVVARVKAVLRRSNPPREESKRIVEGPVILDEDSREVRVAGALLKLTPSEFMILKVMMSRPNRVFSRNELLDLAIGSQFEGYDRTIDSHIRNLRKKIKDALPDLECIHSIYGAGYKFNLIE
ncbi:two-component system, OmpR family, response regulator BaeR [Desulfatibacillum alkenivorans DSM 16219]|uniref:Two-component system, OmpR family, response regulator BaeR n=1 Tax=Desulfatibacillum alkenivorans DSM 16219 TaxID=1121393 RepID=A0A1M6XBW3_9BACT|nr:response regulator [Desulfatibacillum alkenivorans]SHL03398.1 two-component system, OmpR family, response regulator BaeR [Desulfatibacillum alkenivorans DSM 16219]